MLHTRFSIYMKSVVDSVQGILIIFHFIISSGIWIHLICFFTCRFGSRTLLWAMQFQRHLVTASYVSEAMQALNERAKEAGVTLLCEMGLDPGIGNFPTFLILSDYTIFHP